MYQAVFLFFILPTHEFKVFQCEFCKVFGQEDKYVKNWYYKAKFLVKGDFNCRTRKRHIELPQLFDICENCNAESYNFAKNKTSKDKRCNAEGRKLVYFYKTTNFKILNGKSQSNIERKLFLKINWVVMWQTKH